MSDLRANRHRLSAICLAGIGGVSWGSANAQVLAATPSSAINLICVGTASKDEQVGTALDFLAGDARTERVGNTDSISFTLNPDNTGTVRLPRRMQSAHKEANKDGSFNLVKVATSENEITGQVRIHGMNKPRFRLDRLTGIVTVEGTLASFSGRCEPYDPAKVQRRF